jgi:hypothetical protein
VNNSREKEVLEGKKFREKACPHVKKKKKKLRLVFVELVMIP